MPRSTLGLTTRQLSERHFPFVLIKQQQHMRGNSSRMLCLQRVALARLDFVFLSLHLFPEAPALDCTFRSVAWCFEVVNLLSLLPTFSSRDCSSTKVSLLCDLPVTEDLFFFSLYGVRLYTTQRSIPGRSIISPSDSSFSRLLLFAGLPWTWSLSGNISLLGLLDRSSSGVGRPSIPPCAYQPH